MKKNLGLIIFSWSSCRWTNIGGKALPSSYDTYDREYGWTAEDFSRASGGTDVRLCSIEHLKIFY